MRRIGFVGVGGVGKSEATCYIRNVYDFKSAHVKDVLGEMVAPILVRLGVPIDEIKDHIFASKIDAPLPGAPHLTTRILLQAQGNGFLKESDLMLAQKMAIDMHHPGTPLVIESVRYPREGDYLRKNGFHLIRITRPGYDGLVTNAGTHESERGENFPVDTVIANDGSLPDLYASLDRLLLKNGVRIIDTRPDEFRLILVNGRPRSGKDSFVDATINYLTTNYAVPCIALSSIDVVRDMLKKAAIDVSQKTPEDRALLSNLGSMIEQHSEARTRYVLQQAGSQGYLARNCVVFVHVREKYVMQNLLRVFDSATASIGGMRASLLWVNRPGFDSGTPSNASDAIDGSEMEYDFSFTNDDGVYALQCAAAKFGEALRDGVTQGHFAASAAKKEFPPLPWGGLQQHS